MSPGDAEWYRQPLVQEILDGVDKTAAAVMKWSGRRGLLRVSLSSETGLLLGIAPGTAATIHTSCGAVELYCERNLSFEYRYDRLERSGSP